MSIWKKFRSILGQQDEKEAENASSTISDQASSTPPTQLETASEAQQQPVVETAVPPPPPTPPQKSYGTRPPHIPTFETPKSTYQSPLTSKPLVPLLSTLFQRAKTADESARYID